MKNEIPIAILITFIYCLKKNIQFSLFWQNIYGGEIWKQYASICKFIQALRQVMITVIDAIYPKFQSAATQAFYHLS